MMLMLSAKSSLKTRFLVSLVGFLIVFGISAIAMSILANHGALEVAERVRETMVRPMNEPGRRTPLAVSVSIGATECTDSSLACADFVAQADAAMYRAKQSGRNCVRLHT